MAEAKNNSTKKETSTTNLAQDHGITTGIIDGNGRKITAVYQDKSHYVIYGTDQGLTLYNPNLGPKNEQIQKTMNDLTDMDAKFHVALNALHLEDVNDLGDYFSIAGLFRELRNRVIGRFKGRSKYESEFAALYGAVLDSPARMPATRVQMEELFSRMRMERTHRMRVSFLSINLFCVLIVQLLFLGVQYTKFNFFGFDLQQLAIAAMMGGVGALFSTATSLKRLEMDPLLNPFVHLVYAAQRVLIGVLAAVILLFGFKSGILFDILSPPNSATPQFLSTGDAKTDILYWIGFISVIAGFSERLVPNLLATQAKRIEDHQNTFTEYELQQLKEVLAERNASSEPSEPADGEAKQ